MIRNFIDADELIKALKDKWNKEHPVYDDYGGSMSYDEIIDFIREFAYENTKITEIHKT